MARIPSEFVPLDVNYAHDRAIRQAGPMAELLFVRSLAYARKMRPVTGGLIPDYDLTTVAAGIPNAKRHAAALVRERLWVTAKGGWHIRSFAKWNPQADGAAQSVGGRIGNHNRWHTEGRWSPDCDLCTPPPPADLLAITTESPTDHSPDHSLPIGTESGTDRSRSQSKREREKETDGERQASNVQYVTREAGDGLTSDGDL